MNVSLPVAMMTVDQFAAERKVSRRTVMRRLASDKGIPGAEKRGKQWMIPADANVSDTGHGTVARAERPAAAAVGPALSLAALLDGKPAFLSIEDAALLLGISEYAVRSNRVEFGGLPVGSNGATMIPQATVRRIAGI